MSSSENLRDQQTLPAVIIRGQGNWGGALGLTHGKGTCDLRINSELPETARALQARAGVHTSWQSSSLTLPLPTGPSRPHWCGDNCGERTRACGLMSTQAPPLTRPESGTALELTRLPLGWRNFPSPLCSKTSKIKWEEAPHPWKKQYPPNSPTLYLMEPQESTQRIQDTISRKELGLELSLGGETS